MSNFNEDRRQGCVDFKYEPYRDNWKDKIYIYIKYKDFWDLGGGGGVRGVVIIIVTARMIDM